MKVIDIMLFTHYEQTYVINRYQSEIKEDLIRWLSSDEDMYGNHVLYREDNEPIKIKNSPDFSFIDKNSAQVTLHVNSYSDKMIFRFEIKPYRSAGITIAVLTGIFISLGLLLLLCSRCFSVNPIIALIPFIFSLILFLMFALSYKISAGKRLRLIKEKMKLFQ